MRATINFEVDVDRVQATMAAVAREELQPLHHAMDLLEVSKPQDLHDGISKALEILGAVATQLEQYRDMLTSFERARFETILPQSAEEALLPVEGGQAFNNLSELRANLNNMQEFTKFVQQEEETDDAEEG